MIIIQQISSALDSETPGSSLRQHPLGRPLLTPGKVHNPPFDLETLFLPRQRPIVVRERRHPCNATG
jgi:hypothetical protein